MGSLLLAIPLWAAVLGAALEVWARADLHWTSHRNEHVLRLRDRTLRLAAAMDSSLWSRPWHSYRPHLDVRIPTPEGEFVFRTDSLGFRTDPVGIPKPDDVYRIVCVGGSTTVEGLTNETTYPGRLQAILRERLGTDRIEVINCGVSGYTSRMEALQVEDYLCYEPDLVVEYNGVNDLWTRTDRYERRLGSVRRQLARSAWVRRVFSRHLLPPAERRAERWTIDTIRQLTRFQGRMKAAGVPVVFATFARPEPADLVRSEQAFFLYDLHYGWDGQVLNLQTYVEEIDFYNRALTRFCRERSLPLVPVHEVVRGGAEHFVDVCHMTPTGIALKAEVIAEHLIPIVASHPRMAGGNRD